MTRNSSATVDYITKTFVTEHDWLKAARAKGEELVPGMQLSPYEGYLLSWLVRMSGAKQVLEIGTFMGSSALWMATALPKDGHVTTLEFKPEHALLARRHVAASPHAQQVEVLEGDALTWLESQKPQAKFDFIFIDAEKRNYPNYLEAALPLLNPHAWVVGDNTLLFGALSGAVPDAASAEAKAGMQKFNELLADKTKFDGVLLPTPEGLTVARKKTNYNPGEEPLQARIGKSSAQK